MSKPELGQGSRFDTLRAKLIAAPLLSAGMFAALCAGAFGLETALNNYNWNHPNASASAETKLGKEVGQTCLKTIEKNGVRDLTDFYQVEKALDDNPSVCDTSRLDQPTLANATEHFSDEYYAERMQNLIETGEIVTVIAGVAGTVALARRKPEIA